MKIGIKKILLTTSLILALSMPSRATAQGIPVYDNVNFISFVKQLLEAGKQTANIIKTVKFLKKQKENIEKVSAAIEKLKAVQELIRNNKRLYDMVQGDLRDILNSPHIRADEVERISTSFNAILDQATEDLEFINEILSSDHLKLTDGERMRAIRAHQQESKEMVTEIERKTERYRDIIAFREMQDKINNRKTNY
ncbi:type IV secretion system protein [Maribacter sp. 4G9]|uniref:type IV secretion system protein n=1 Tax=Maribacter sp. 4G9 TaxID=1889777 RepID=UPI000C54CEF5|nr:type IV secretion system protein [Maribacter sp. 4G9]PIB38315.1 conjugal transfer protein [Maribacter sp. 4G9]